LSIMHRLAHSPDNTRVEPRAHRDSFNRARRLQRVG
jgi:hypothetical protein